MNAQPKILNCIEAGDERRKAVKSEMARRGMTVGQLAEKSGFRPRSFYVSLSRGLQGKPTCWRVEAGLGYSFPIVSDLRQLTLRKACVTRNGWDPFLVPLDELIVKARALGIPFSTRDRADLQDKVLERLAASPKQTPAA